MATKVYIWKAIFQNLAPLQCCGPSLEFSMRVWRKLIQKWPRNTPTSIMR